MQEPRPGVIRPEADGNIITSVPRVDDVAPNGVLIVVCRTTSAPDYIKYVLGISENEFKHRADEGTHAVKMKRMLELMSTDS